MNWIIWTIAIWGSLLVILMAALGALHAYSKSKKKDQAFVTRNEIFQMGYDAGFLNKGYDQSIFADIEDDEARSSMTLVYRGGFTEGLQDYHYLRRDSPLN